MGACGAPPEPVAPPAPTVAPRPVRPAVTAVASAAPSVSASAEVEEAPEPPLVDPLAPLPAGAVARLGTTRMRFRTRTTPSAAFTASGGPLVLEDGSRGMVVRDLLLDRTIAEPGYGRQTVLAPDGAFLVTARPKAAVVVVSLQPLPAGSPRWSVEVKAPQVTQKYFKRVWRGPASVERVFTSPNGSHVAVVFSTGDATVLSARDGSVATRITPGKGRFEALSRDGAHALFLDDGSTGQSSGSFGMIGLLSSLGSFGSSGGPRIKVVQVVDTRTGAVVRKLEPNVVAEVRLSPDGREIVALWAGTLVAVNVATGARRVLREEGVTSLFGGWGAPPRSFLMAPDGSRVAISDGSTDVVSLADGAETESDLEGTPVCFSPGGDLLLMRSENVARVVGRNDDLLDGHEAAVTTIAFAAGGKMLASSAEDVRFWNPRTGRSMARVASVKARSIASDPAAEHLVLATPELRAAAADGKLVDIGPPQPGLVSGSTRKPRVEQAAPLPGGEVVAVVAESSYSSSGNDARIRLWSMKEPREIARAEVASPTDIAAGPGGSRIAVAARGSGSAVHLFDAGSLEMIRELPVDSWSDITLAFAGNDARLLVGKAWHGGASLFDVDRGVVLKRFYGGDCCVAIAASPDGRLAAGAAGKAVLLWQIEPRKLLSVFRGHQGSVKALAFSPDGARLASASEDTSILVWDTSAALPPERPTFVVKVPDVTSVQQIGPDSSGMLVVEAGKQAPGATTPASPTGRVRQVRITGDGAPGVTDVPGRVADMKQVVSVISARCALDGTGNVRCWGMPFAGVLGGGFVKPPKWPAKMKSIDAPQLVKLPAKATQLFGSSQYVCATLAGGDLACWGSLVPSSSPGFPGAEALVDTRPAVVSGLVDVVSAGIGRTFACALEKSGRVLCWGKNDHGQLGEAQSKGSVVPVAVPGITDARALSVGDSHACVVHASGALTCWGEDERDQVGGGTGLTASIPRTFGTGFAEVAAGTATTCARQTGGDVLCWGAPGRSSTIPMLEPTKVPAAAGLTQLRMAGDLLCGDRNATEVVCVGFREVEP